MKQYLKQITCTGSQNSYKAHTTLSQPYHGKVIPTIQVYFSKVLISIALSQPYPGKVISTIQVYLAEIFISMHQSSDLMEMLFWRRY